MSGEQENPGLTLRDHAITMVEQVKPCDYLTVKHDGYTVTVSKDSPTQRVEGFAKAQP